MPIYEYSCENCGQFELTQKITDKALTRCPTCKGKVKKLISHTSFQLKGTGWYVTDYARKDKAPKEEKSPASAADGNGKAAAHTGGTEKTTTETKSTEKKPVKNGASESTHP